MQTIFEYIFLLFGLCFIVILGSLAFVGLGTLYVVVWLVIGVCLLLDTISKIFFNKECSGIKIIIKRGVKENGRTTGSTETKYDSTNGKNA